MAFLKKIFIYLLLYLRARVGEGAPAWGGAEGREADSLRSCVGRGWGQSAGPRDHGPSTHWATQLPHPQHHHFEQHSFFFFFGYIFSYRLKGLTPKLAFIFFIFSQLNFLFAFPFLFS